jgi:DNA-binding NtrC family response regulator
MSALRPAFPLLLVDDDDLLLQTLRELLQAEGITNVLTRTRADDLYAVVRASDVGVVLLDLALPGVPGREALADLSARAPEIPVIVVTGNHEISTAVACMRAGAFDYLTKPMARADLAASVRRAIEVAELRRENRVLNGLLWEPPPEVPRAFATTVTRDPRMIALLRYAELVARTGHPVLVTGETGTGKELVARGIHAAAGRAGPFLAVNVAGLDDAMLADTLFGHLKGAFTGADAQRRGMVEVAADGTLFLDEIGDLSAASQVKLLRLAEAREYLPLGAEMPRRSDAALVVATNRSLEEAVEAGGFRRDLYYRLRTHRLHLPPLRERRGDVRPLLEHFVEAAAAELGVPVPPRSDAAMELLEAHPFAGNVRELRSLVFDAMSRDPADPLAVDKLRPLLGGAASAVSARATRVLFPAQLPTLDEAAAALEDEALQRAGGNQTEAARLLGISQPALSKRLKRRKSFRAS